MKAIVNVFLLAIITLSLVSCAKEATLNIDPNQPTANSVDTSYQPSSAGSTWLYYTRDTTGRLIDSITVSSTGRDTSINNVQYKILHYDTTYQFQFHSGNQYGLRTTAYTFATTSGNINVNGFNILYINNETDSVGSQWNFDCIDGKTVSTPLGPIPTRAIGTVKGVGLSDTENGNLFNKVFMSHIVFQAIIPSFPPTTSYSTIQSIDIYAARGVGIIKIVTYNQKGQIATIQSLKSYTIK